MKRRILAAASLLVFLSAGLGYAWRDKLEWRARLVSQATARDLPGVTLTDVALALGPDRFMPEQGPAKLARNIALRNLDGIRNPHTSEADVQAGREIFTAYCASCHGLQGGGAAAPDLSRGRFEHGAGDWALFQTIRNGVPGTAMKGLRASPDSVWRLVAFVRSLAMKGNDREEGAKPVDGSEPGVPGISVPYDRLRNAADAPEDWALYSGTYDGRRRSPLAAIDTTNVNRLVPRWVFQFDAPEKRVEATPIVVDGVMFVSAPPNRVYALDAATGEELWSYERELPDDLRIPYDPVNRGVAVLGDRVFMGTLDAHLVALDIETGSVIWDVPVAENRHGYTITGAPLALKDIVVTGVGGGMHGIRGFIDAYDAASGERRWRFYTVPGPGEPGHETWSGDSWKHGGAGTWNIGSYDPELDLLYWGVGNPGPAFYGDVREGDNLYSNSVVALDPDTGELVWHFQFTPHDVHDWDATQIPILVDGTFDGEPRKLLLQANRNGFFYALDRASGEFLRATEFSRQNWATKIDENGRPVVRPGSETSVKGSLVYPGFLGGTNWWPPAYSDSTGYLYVLRWGKPNLFFKSSSPPSYRPGQSYTGGYPRKLPDEETVPQVRAIDYRTGEIEWSYPVADFGMGGLLTTAGGLVFGSAGTEVFALDAEDGQEYWSYNAGGPANAGPISYEVDGTQYVAVTMGRSLFAFALPSGYEEYVSEPRTIAANQE